MPGPHDLSHVGSAHSPDPSPPEAEFHEPSPKRDVGRTRRDGPQFDTQHKLPGAGWETPVLALLVWEDRSNFHVRFPGSKGPSFGGSQEGLAERDPIPTNQPQSIPSFPSANSGAQQPAVPSLASSKDQLSPPTMIQRY